MTNDDERPDPEILLKAIGRLGEPNKRGRLRIFLGMCPGVGKTYAMLKTAQERLKKGERVLIALVETHGRVETQELSLQIPHIPRIKITHKNAVYEELDLEAVIKAAPDLVLVDELAHSNFTGQRHKKRFQDIEEILNHGIDVFTTVNIQHIESVKDSVHKITGINVRETVPDYFFDSAEQIEIIDLSPNELLLRLKDGKVYLGERAGRAAENFFKIEHLTALRELALRFIATKVDHELQDQMVLKGMSGKWKTSEKLLVGISHSPYSAGIIRATKRMASTIDCPWYALYVQTNEVLTPKDQAQLAENIELVKNLRGELLTSMDTDILHSIRRVCSEKNITQIILGRPDKRFFQDFFQGNLLDRLVELKNEVDIHVIRSERAPIRKGFRSLLSKIFPGFRSSLYSYYGAIWLIFILAIAGYAIEPLVGYRSIGSLFLVGILFLSTFLTRGPLIFCAFMSALVWNFFFIPPKFTLAIGNKEDTLMAFSYFIAALVGGILTSKIKKQEDILGKREKQTRVLYEFTKGLSLKSNEDEITNFLKATLEDNFEATIKILLKDESANTLSGNVLLLEKDFSVAQWSFDHNKKAGWSTSTLSLAGCLSLPLSGDEKVLGAVILYPRDKTKPFSIEQEIFIDSLLKQASLALERFILGKQVDKLKLAEVSKELHKTLLNSISHEMRTPLTALIGSASALTEKSISGNPETRDLLTNEIISSAQRLNRVVENLLDLSRLERDDLALKKEWFTLEDFTHELKSYLHKELKNHTLTLRGDKDVLIEADFTLLLHAFSNLVSNAIKYGPEKADIHLVVQKNDQKKDKNESIDIHFYDNGPGINLIYQEEVFEKFFRLPDSRAGGLGLGLAIVKSIIGLHNGSITLSEAYPGACFLISLPLKKVPPSINKLVSDEN